LVIDRFQVVEVEEGEGDRLRLATGTSDLALALIQECPAIGYPRQGIGERRGQGGIAQAATPAAPTVLRRSVNATATQACTSVS